MKLHAKTIVQFNTNLDPALYEQLVTMAHDERRTIREVVTHLLNLGLAHYQDPPDTTRKDVTA